MVRREIQARYARSLFGLAWSYINPTVRFFTFYFVFGILLERGNIQNFAIHLFAGMVLVHYFTETVNSGTRSLLSNKGVVQKMAMPRELFPFASMLVSLYHTIPQLIILTIACLWTRTWIPDMEGMAAALLGFAITLLFGTALGLMFSVFNVLLRDFGRIVQTFINVLPFTVPMMYPYSMVTERFGTGWQSRRDHGQSVDRGGAADPARLLVDDHDRAVRQVLPRRTCGSAASSCSASAHCCSSSRSGCSAASRAGSRSC